MNACSTPLSWERLVAYWADDLSERDLEAADEHLMGCASCSQRSEHIAQVSQTLRELLPPVVSEAQLAALRARGSIVSDNVMEPGERREVWFPASADVLIHRLRGLDFTDAEQVSFSIHDERSGTVMVTMPDVPFDASSGEVLVACQRHYASMPPDTVMDVRVRRRNGTTQHNVYTVLHRY